MTLKTRLTSIAVIFAGIGIRYIYNRYNSHKTKAAHTIKLSQVPCPAYDGLEDLSTSFTTNYPTLLDNITKGHSYHIGMKAVRIAGSKREIPKKIHFVWVTNPVAPRPVISNAYESPKGLEPNLDNTLALMPPYKGWEYYLWTNVDLPFESFLPTKYSSVFKIRYIDELALFKAIDNNIQSVFTHKNANRLSLAVDFAKYSLLPLGGFVIDWNYVFIVPIPPSALRSDFIHSIFVTQDGSNRGSNEVMIAIKNSFMGMAGDSQFGAKLMEMYTVLHDRYGEKISGHYGYHVAWEQFSHCTHSGYMCAITTKCSSLTQEDKYQIEELGPYGIGPTEYCLEQLQDQQYQLECLSSNETYLSGYDTKGHTWSDLE